MPKQHNILVTGVGGPAGVNAVRLLQEFKNKVGIFGVDSGALSAGRAFTDDFTTIALVSDKEQYRTDLLACIKRWNITCIVPTVSEELVHIHDVLKDVLVTIIASPRETLELCHDKRKLYEFMSARLPNAMVKWQTLEKPLAFAAPEYFLKPAMGRGGRGCRKVAAEALKNELPFIENPETWIAMEVLSGVEWTVDAYITAQGAVRFIVPRERLALSGGISQKGRTVHYAPVIERTKEVLAILPLRGPVCLQWKADAAGNVKQVEINPRLSGGVSITARAGANPLRCIVDELEGNAAIPIEYQDITVVRYFEDVVIPT